MEKGQETGRPPALSETANNTGYFPTTREESILVILDRSRNQDSVSHCKQAFPQHLLGSAPLQGSAMLAVEGLRKAKIASARK